jgi:hypothetical protein
MRNARMAAVLAAVLVGRAMAQPWVDAEAARKLLRAEKFDEAAAAYGAMAKANPFDGDAIAQYGYCLHSLKRYDEALPAFARAVELGVNRPGNLYNAACALSLQGKKDEALAMLRRALEARFADQETLENDTDMDPLRGELRFAELTGITKGLKADPASGREAGWAWDLDFYLRRMEQMHWSLYGKVSREALRGEVEKLKKEAGGLSDSQVRARLKRITAMVGDGHTASRLNAEGEARRVLPLHMFTFKDGMYIIGADSEHQSLDGAKVVGVGSMTTEAALAALRPYTSVDNEMGYLSQGPAMLCSAVMLKAIGASADESGAELTLERGGTKETVRVEAVEMPAGGHASELVPGFTYLHDGFNGTLPLYLRDAQQPLRVEWVPEAKLVYFWFGAVQDPPGGTFAQTVAKVFDTIKEEQAENLVIDMRFNGGGNTGLVKPLINGLIACQAVNRRGHLFVIIGRHTFSAAQNTVNLIENATEAVFVGEPTGSRPEFVGESTNFVLPHSKTRVFCSSRYWQYMDSTDQRTWVQPRVVAEPTFADYAAGRDGAMDAVIRLVGASKPAN